MSEKLSQISEEQKKQIINEAFVVQEQVFFVRVLLLLKNFLADRSKKRDRRNWYEIAISRKEKLREQVRIER